MKKLSFFCACLLLFQGTRAQSYDSQRSAVLLVNVVSNALIGGIGGAIHHHAGEKTYRAFIRNFFKGGVGGLVKYSAKYETYFLSRPNLSLLVPVDRLYYFLGHSITLNAAYNRKALETYSCNFWGIDLRFDSKAEQKIRARLSLATLVGATEYGIRGYELNLYRSLEYGFLFFDDPQYRLSPFDGESRFNCIVISKGSDEVLPHEIVHTFQMYDLFGISSFYDKKLRPHYENRKLYKILSEYVVADYEGLFFSAVYFTQPKPRYYKNYFEFEAEHFKSRSYIRR